MKILMVLTSHDQLGDTGRKTGFWLEEFAAPSFVFRDAGVELTLASTKGGQPPIDPKSDLPGGQTPAMARHVEVEISYTKRLLRLRIRDDGMGIRPEVLEQGRSGHYGLSGMRERAIQIGAKLTIWSGDGSGTEIDLRVAGPVAYAISPKDSRLRRFRGKQDHK